MEKTHKTRKFRSNSLPEYQNLVHMYNRHKYETLSRSMSDATIITNKNSSIKYDENEDKNYEIHKYFMFRSSHKKRLFGDSINGIIEMQCKLLVNILCEKKECYEYILEKKVGLHFFELCMLFDIKLNLIKWHAINIISYEHEPFRRSTNANNVITKFIENNLLNNKELIKKYNEFIMIILGDLNDANTKKKNYIIFNIKKMKIVSCIQMAQSIINNIKKLFEFLPNSIKCLILEIVSTSKELKKSTKIILIPLLFLNIINPLIMRVAWIQRNKIEKMKIINCARIIQIIANNIVNNVEPINDDHIHITDGMLKFIDFVTNYDGMCIHKSVKHNLIIIDKYFNKFVDIIKKVKRLWKTIGMNVHQLNIDPYWVMELK
jgi:hypothetical protein